LVACLEGEAFTSRGKLDFRSQSPKRISEFAVAFQDLAVAFHDLLLHFTIRCCISDFAVAFHDFAVAFCSYHGTPSGVPSAPQIDAALAAAKCLQIHQLRYNDRQARPRLSDVWNLLTTIVGKRGLFVN